MAPPPRRSFQEATPRKYQLEILSKAMAENTILCLQTGCGKTLIAVLLIEKLSHLFRYPAKSISIFLAPTVCLCEQQAQVIEEYTDLHVARLFGGISIDWDAETWLDRVQNHEVFVMTPEILLKALRHAFLKPETIELLIFDECHHAAKGHPYANIMVEFFHEPSARSPRVFGMTASPINKKGQTSSGPSKFKSEIQSLESTLLSKICTVRANGELEMYVPTSELKIKSYHVAYTEGSVEVLCQNKLDNIFQATGRLLLENGLFEEREQLNRIHLSLRYCLGDLGLWCARQAAKLFLGSSKGGPYEYVSRAIQVFDQSGTADYSEQKFPDASGMSTKVHLLLEVLDEYRNHENLRCIVFVTRVIAAQVLSVLLNLKPFISCKYLASQQTRKMSRTGQKTTIEDFRVGKINVLVATNVAEEGLDIQSCFLVIRFDLPKTERSNIQSRGRARQPGSDYVILLKYGSLEQEELLNSLLLGEDMMYNQIHEGSSGPNESRYDEKDCYRVEATGAIVNVDSSVSLLHLYCSSLHSGGNTAQPRYRKWKTAQGYVYEVRLPDKAEVNKVFGPPCETEDIAKRMACLEACRQLHNVGALDDHLLPYPRKSDSGIEEATLNQMELHGTCMPDVLAGSVYSSTSVSLYGHLIRISGNSKRQFQSFGIFLSASMESTSIDLDLGRGENVSACLTPIEAVIFDSQKIRLAECFLEKVFPALLSSRSWHGSRAYCLLPLRSDSTGLVIDWDQIQQLLSPVTSAASVDNGITFGNCCLSTKDSRGLIVTTKHTGNQYLIEGVFENLTSSSCFKKAEYSSYTDYFLRRHNLAITLPGQPLLRAKHLKRTENYLLDKTSMLSGVPKLATFVELPPEICTVLVMGLSTTLMNTVQVLPSVLHRIESVLVAAQLRDKIVADNPDIHISLATMLAALTPAACNETFSLERLEFLGDSILKLAVSFHYYGAHSEKREGFLARERQRQISNENLHRLAKRRDIVVYIRQRFDPENCWFSPKLACSGHSQSEAPKCDKGHRWLSLKSIADVSEALIGGFLVDSDAAAAVKFMMWLGLDLTTHITVPVTTFGSTVDGVKLDMLEQRINYSFRNKALLVQAFTHGSYDVVSYQRMEFLGDAILDYLVVLHLYAKFPFLDPGLLSLLKSATVNNQWLAYKAVACGLQEFLIHDSQALSSDIEAFLSRNMGKSFEDWQEDMSPKVLGDLMESLVAAVFLDTEGDLVQVWDVIRPLIEPIASPDSLSLHPVCELQELCQLQAYSHYYVEDEQLLHCNVKMTEELTLVGSGEGRNKQIAKRQAAVNCLAQLKAQEVEHPLHKLVEAIKRHPNPQINSDIINKGMRLGATIKLEAVCKTERAEEPAFAFDMEDEDELEGVNSEVLTSGSIREELLDLSASLKAVTYSGENSGEVTTDRSLTVSTPSIHDTVRTHTSQVLASSRNTLEATDHNATPSGQESSSTRVPEDRRTYVPGVPRSELKMLCDRRKWANPVFKCQDEQGPSHLKQFTYSVSIMVSDSDRLDFPPGDPMPRVKDAQDAAAELALEWLRNST